jgi:hypothetical protein
MWRPPDTPSHSSQSVVLARSPAMSPGASWFLRDVLLSLRGAGRPARRGRTARTGPGPAPPAPERLVDLGAEQDKHDVGGLGDREAAAQAAFLTGEDTDSRPVGVDSALLAELSHRDGVRVTGAAVEGGHERGDPLQDIDPMVHENL